MWSSDYRKKRKNNLSHMLTYFYPFFTNIAIKKLNKKKQKRMNWISTFKK